MSNLGELFATTAATGPIILGFFAAAVAGLVSFASPCVVPLVPGYISYLASISGGHTIAEPTTGIRVAKTGRYKVVAAALLFIAGFTVVFLLATVTVFGAISALALNGKWLTQIGGIITIIMGLVFLGWIPFLQEDKRFQPKQWTTWLGAPLLGGVFALGWTPCLGPTLGAIISISAGTEGATAARGVLMIIGYCVGLGLPFFLLAFGSAAAMSGVGFLRRHSRTIQTIGGVALILVGIALVTGLWGEFINWIQLITLEFGATAL